MSDKTVLLVEDDPRDQELTMRALQKSKVQYQVVVAHDGVEALDYLFGRGAHSGRDVTEVPALIILDLKLPRLTGIEVLREIRANPVTRLVPAVILTSSNQDEDLMASYSEGANSYVQKPVEFTEFATAVANLGLYWLTVNEPLPDRG
jgi:two-component system response regulator